MKANKIKKIIEIINIEGMILGLYKDEHQKYFFKSLIKPGGGYITYKVSKEILKDFYNDKYTIEDLLRFSESKLIDYDFRRDKQTFVKDDFYGKLHCGNKKVSDFSDGIVPTMPDLD